MKKIMFLLSLFLVFSMLGVVSAEKSNSDILIDLQNVITSKYTNFSGVSLDNKNFDLNSDNQINALDLNLLVNIRTSTSDGFFTIYIKLTDEIRKRVGSKTGESLYIEGFDVNRDGTITKYDLDKISNVLNEGRSVKELLLPGIRSFFKVFKGEDAFDTNFDVWPDGRINSVDLSALNGLGKVDSKQFEEIYTKLSLAVSDRMNSKDGDSNYVAELDFNSDGTITQTDLEIMQTALKEGISIYSASCSETDLTGDNIVNAFDLLRLRQCMSNSSQDGCSKADINKNGFMGYIDLDYIRNYYRQGCSSTETPQNNTNNKQYLEVYEPTASTKDLTTLTDVNVWLRNNKGIQFTINKSSGLTKSKIYNSFTIYIKNKRVMIILPSSPSDSDLSLAADLGSFLSGKGLASGSFTIKSSELIYEDISKSMKEYDYYFYPKDNKVSCTDSDGGIDYYTKGSTRYMTSGIDDIDDDTCINNKTLSEQYCEGNQENKQSIISCENGCSNGVCIKRESKLTFEYILADEGEGNYKLYINPNYPEVEDSKIFITAGFESVNEETGGANRIMTWSNDPLNRDYKTLEYDSDLGAYYMGSISKSELSEFNKLKVILDSGSESKEWSYNVNSLIVTKITRESPKIKEGPVKIPKEINDSLYICNGCVLDDKCYPLGYRKSGEYCSDSSSFVKQTTPNKACENNFECSSNVCVSNQCISEGLIQKVLNWFKRVFGNN